MTRQTVLVVALVSLVVLAGCSTLTGSPSEPTTTEATMGQTSTGMQTTEQLTTTVLTTGPMTATPVETTMGTTIMETVTVTETATPSPTPSPTPTPTPTATPTETPSPTPTRTPSPTPTDAPASQAAIGPEPPLDAAVLATNHEEGLRTAGSFVVNVSSTLRGSEGPETNRRSAQVDLGANSAYQVSRPTEEATRYTYAEGTTAYKKNVLEGFDDPQYEVEQLGRPLTESLLSSNRLYETVLAIDYERAGTVTRDGRQLAVYVANGTDSVDSSKPAFRGEEITEFSSTLVLDSETGIVHTLRTERTTDYLSSGEPVTIVETVRFSAIGSTSVDQPAWVTELKQTDG